MNVATFQIDDPFNSRKEAHFGNAIVRSEKSKASAQQRKIAEILTDESSSWTLN